MARYLITGGTGFLGARLINRLILEGHVVKTIARDAEKLIALKDEYKDKITICKGDISDREVVRDFVEDCDGVFHLAAFKYVPLAEVNTRECVRTNVMGSVNLLEECASKDVKFVIGISTSAAAQMTGVYGASKYIMEKVFQECAKTSPNALRMVRYGNVLYSTGSVLCKWKDLIQQGKDVSITSKEATRFFLTIDQALDLIFDCLDNSKDAKPYVTEMKGMAMGDVLDAMIQKYAHSSINVITMGLQKGENLHEKIMEQGPYSNEKMYTKEEIMQLI